MPDQNDHPEPARANPLVRQFVDTVDGQFETGIPTFAGLEKRVLMPYWRNLIIVRQLPDGDFLMVFFGSGVVAGFNRDLTGTKLSESLEGEVLERITEKNRRCLNDRSRIYSSGNMEWQHRDYTRWYQVKMPMERNGKIDETVSFTVYD